jgi:diguanylate cyclase (GGDEF)-like protein
MGNLLRSWRFYLLEQEHYKECMRKMSVSNLHALYWVDAAVALLAVVFAIFPLIVENNVKKAMVYFATAAFMLLFCVFTKRKFNLVSQGKQQAGTWFIYTLITIYYATVMSFGIYLGVWSNPHGMAVVFMCFIICALFLFITPIVFNICLTLSALSVFIVSSVLFKSPDIWAFDVVNAVLAGCASLFFGWKIIAYRLAAVSIAIMLEQERNSYYNQSTIDELTQLKNRRDFILTFQRYLSHYRDLDQRRCNAIIDIDFFKKYNDYYGHQKGDECLRAVGEVLNSLRDSMGVYAARVGGEEFALLWFEKEACVVNDVVSRVNQMIKNLNIPHIKSRTAPHITVSMGVYIAQCSVPYDMDTLYNLADKALYSAKRKGRNCAVVCGDGFNEYVIPPETYNTWNCFDYELSAAAVL